MQKENFFQRALKFAESKGFYMILGLCVVAIGVSAYVLFFTTPEQGTLNGEVIPSEPQAGVSNTVPDVTVPDDEQPDEPEPTVRTPLRDNKPTQPEPEDATSSPVQDEKVPSDAEISPEELQKPAATVPVNSSVSVKEPIFTLPVQSASVQREYTGDVLVKDPTMGDWRTHGGTDFVCDEGDQVMAVLEGSVTDIFQDAMMGQCIRIDHGSGLESLYCGVIAQDGLKSGQQVSVGQIIGRVSGDALAESAQECHLHLEFYEDGLTIDPMSVLK